MAQRGEDHLPQACLVVSDDSDAAGQGGDIGQDTAGRTLVAGLSGQGADRQSGQHALLEVERQEQEAGAIQRGQHHDHGDCQIFAESAALCSGPNDNIEMSLAGENGGLGQVITGHILGIYKIQLTNKNIFQRGRYTTNQT